MSEIKGSVARGEMRRNQRREAVEKTGDVRREEAVAKGGGKAKGNGVNRNEGERGVKRRKVGSTGAFC